MKKIQFSFNDETLSNIFPYYLLINQNLKIISFGKSIIKIIPQLSIDIDFNSIFNISRPFIKELSKENIDLIFNQLVIITSKNDELLSLRGQFEIQNDCYLFVGSPWFSSMEEVVNKKLTLHDFAFHDSMLDLLHILKNQDINNSELKELLSTVNNQRKKLKKDKEELNRLSLVASANKNGVIFIYPNGEIFWCNEAYLHLTGYLKEEVIGKKPLEIGKNDFSDKLEIKKMLDAFYSGKSFDVEIIHKRNDNSLFWSRSKGQPILNEQGEVVQYFVIFEDISVEKEISKQLIDSENRLTSLIVNLQSAVLLEDEHRKILLVNKKFCTLFGINSKPEKLINLDCKVELDTIKLLFKNPDTFINNTNEIVTKQKEVLEEELELIDGRVFERSFIPIIRKNKFAGNLWSYEDITLKKKYKESLEIEREKYSSIIANMNMGLLEVDLNDKITLANQSFCDMSGYTLEELLGKEASKLLLSEESKKVVHKKNDKRKIGQSDSYEITSKDKVGKVRHWLISGAPNYNINGEVIGSIGIHLDITNQKILEIQKEQLLKRLEKQNQQLNEYAQIVSHDLKSPLRSIHSLITWIKEDNDKEFNDQTKQYLEMIEEKVEKMDHLIQGILTYSKVDTDENIIEKISLMEVLKNIITTIDIPKNIEIKIIKNLPDIFADKFRMQQLFQNIISNAVNYNDKSNGLIEVDWKLENNYYIFSIKDNGPGIAKENQDKIFKIFQSFTSDQKATGIGLSIVKRIVDNYNGEIFIESELNLGTTFFIKLPKTKS